MRIDINSNVCAAIGEMYKRGNDGMSIMEVLIVLHEEKKLSRQVEKLQHRLRECQEHASAVLLNNSVPKDIHDVLTDWA